MESSLNPWSLDDKMYKSLSDVCLLWKKHKVTRKKSNVEIEELEKKIQKNDPSLNFISLLEHIGETRTKLYEVKFETQQRLLNQDITEILHTNQIDQKMQDISSFNKYLKSIVQERQILLTTLQRPLVENSINLEVKYHSTTEKMMCQISNILGELVKNLDNIEWIRQADFLAAPNNLNEVFACIETSLARLNTSYQQLSNIRSHTINVPSASWQA